MSVLLNRVKALSLIAVLVALSACGSDKSQVTNNPPNSAREQPQTRFDMANGCYALKPAGSTNFAQITSQGRYAASATSLADAEALHFKPTALGDYLLHARNKTMMAAQANNTASRPHAEESTVWTIEAVSPGVFTLFSPLAGKVLALADNNDLVLQDPAAAGSKANFKVVQHSGCTTYPEINLDLVGRTYKGNGVDKPVIGFAEVHTHMAMGHEMSDGSRTVGPSAGGVMYGQMFHRFGVPHAMEDCKDWHGPQGIRDPEALILDLTPLTTHDTQGWPSFINWPASDSQLHQAMYYKWVERAWMAGMRIMVSEGTNIEALCELGSIASLRPGSDCSDMSVGIKQTKYLFELQDYVDAQEGGPGKGWFRIVRSPQEARKVINEGKLAVVAGLEFSNVFKCTLRYDLLGNEVHGCSKEDIDRQIEEVWDLGVREIFPYHDVNSALGGTGIFSGDVLNLINFLGTNKFWETEDCPDGGEGDGYFYPAGAIMTTAIPGTGNDPVTSALISLVNGKLPLYNPNKRQCNARGMTDLGRYAMEKLMQKKFVIDIDHAAMKVKNEMIAMAKAQTPKYPLISAHGGHGGISMQQARDIMEIGGLIYPFMPNGKGHKDFLEKMKDIWPASRGQLPLGYGMDANGIADRAKPRGAGSEPVKYPFTLFDGPDWGPQFNNISPLTVHMQTIPESGKSWHIDEVGMAHYGLVADFVEEVRIEGGKEALDALYHSAEAYIQMWEQVFNR
ncbi:MAG: hypothetical protein Q8L72_10045 [Moraxellaceae bacterium]|nr:hypothetical protein [Moraxellaceae bacterium]